MVSPIIEMINTEKHSGVSGHPTQLMVLHSGECPLRGGYAQSLTKWANIPVKEGGPEASWHWFVDPIAIVSMVGALYSAWHASEANPMSEGFEQAGYARYSLEEWTTPEGMKQMDNLAWLMAQRAIANDIPPVWLTTDQVTAITSLGDRTTKGFCLHRQIDPETRTDPGNGYPYELLMTKIKEYMGVAPTITKEEAEQMGKIILARTPDNGQVWRGNGMERWPVWSMDTVKNLRFWDNVGAIELFKDPKTGADIQTTQDLNALGIDQMAVRGLDFYGKPVKA